MPIARLRTLHVGAEDRTVRSKLKKLEHVMLYGEVQCIRADGHVGLPLWTDRQTDTTENITFATLLAGGNKFNNTSLLVFIDSLLFVL